MKDYSSSKNNGTKSSDNLKRKSLHSMSLRKLFYSRKYMTNYKKMISRVRRSDSIATTSTFDITHLPLDINHSIIKETPEYEIKIYKNYFTVEPTLSAKIENDASFEKTTTNNSIGDLIVHATWTKRVSEDNSDFLRNARQTMRQGCGDYKVFVNADLLNECNYFLLSNKFKCAGSKFTRGDDELSFYYYLTYSQEPLIIPKGLQMSFMVDEENSVKMNFNNIPVKYFSNKNIPDNKDLYVVLTCNLVVAPYNNDNDITITTMTATTSDLI